MKRVHRPEIEGLRALAALLVAVWHIWVGGVSGGVDVFFVVSGLLITTTLLTQLDRFGRVRPLMFLGRLIRRLLPQALLVLLVVIAGVWVWMPDVLRDRALREVFASALYFENWQLAESAVDYLDAEDPHTPVQHFWAMSVQGQFYVLWAVLFLIALALAAGRAARAKRVAFGLLIGVATVSFAYSVWFTSVNQPYAYFSTFARAWEFAIGAIVAFAIVKVSLPRGVALVLGWTGLIGVVSCAIVLDVDNQFPGAVALWPVLAAMMILFAGTERNTLGHAPWLLSRRPLVWLGGLSYGIYLWHFPLVIFYRHITGEHEIPISHGLGIIVASIALSWVTTRFIETPLRVYGDRTSGTRLVAALALVAVAVATAGATVWSRDALNAQAVQQQEAALEELASDERAAECFGAAAAVADGCDGVQRGELLVPARGDLLADTAGAYGCYTAAEAMDITTCRLGAEGEDALRVAIVGNSHAAMFAAGLRDEAEELGWRLDTFVGNGCIWGEPISSERCERRQSQIDDQLMTGAPYDLLLVTTGRGDREHSEERVSAYLDAWEAVEARGTQVIAVTDNPRLPEDVSECVVQRSLDDIAAGACDFSLTDGTRSPDLVAVAAERTDGAVPLVDTMDLFCRDEMCGVAQGNVLMYRDGHHLTGTYVRTMMPYVVERIEDVFVR
nr:acyltransferase family protein [Microbacterium amylolyticum]